MCLSSFPQRRWCPSQSHRGLTPGEAPQPEPAGRACSSSEPLWHSSLFPPTKYNPLQHLCPSSFFFFNRSSRLCISQNALMTCFLFRAYFCISEISSCGCQKHRNSVVTDSMSCRWRHLYFVFMIWTCIHLFICECTAHYPLNGKGLCREYTSTRTGIKNTFPLMEHYSLVLFLLWGQHF